MKSPAWAIVAILISLVASYTNCTSKEASPVFVGQDNTNNCSINSTLPSATSQGSVISMEILPSDTASCITEFNSKHLVYLGDNSITKKGKLFVFLPGTGSTPDQTPSLLRQGALRGYHVIGLMYPNQDSVNSICDTNGNTDLTCFGKVREETVTGQNLSPLVVINDINSIEGRIKALLEYLIIKRPGEGWQDFLQEGNIQWNLVSISGHSQGGGHAAYIAKKYSVFRIGIYSAISDYNTTLNTYPSWFSMPSQTSSTKYFGFIHANDTIANYSGTPGQVADSWIDTNFFNMAGLLINVDSASPPYSNSQRLYTNQYPAASSFIKHTATLFDGYQDIWNYVSFP